MNGKIVIDAYFKNGNHELLIHGGQPDSEADCSLIYSYENKAEAMALLPKIRECLKRNLEA